MGIDIGFAFIITMAHKEAYHPYHLHDSKKMIDVLIRNENMPNVHPIEPGLFDSEKQDIPHQP